VPPLSLKEPRDSVAVAAPGKIIWRTWLTSVGFVSVQAAEAVAMTANSMIEDEPSARMSPSLRARCNLSSAGNARNVRIRSAADAPLVRKTQKARHRRAASVSLLAPPLSLPLPRLGSVRAAESILPQTSERFRQPQPALWRADRSFPTHRTNTIL
jgi:hypothetical protein